MERKTPDMEDGWRKVKYRKAKCLVYEGVPSSLLKEGYPFLYWLRHSETDWSEPYTIENAVFFNRWGVLLSSREIPLGKGGCIHLGKKIRERFRGLADETCF